MALEKSIIKARTAEKSTFEYKPRDITRDSSPVARSFVNEDAFISTDFKISELVAKQAGISQLEDEAHRDEINNLVLERLKEVQEKAYAEGYALGLSEGTEKAFQEAKQNLQTHSDSLENLIKRIEDLKTQVHMENEVQLMNFLFQIAKRIAMRDLEENREAVGEILRQVIHDTQADERVNVRLSQTDLTFLEGLQDKTGKRIESLQRVKFVVDDSITPGGCKIETEYGEINATVEERVERVWQTIKARLPQTKKPAENE